jgi:hypothetical protein
MIKLNELKQEELKKVFMNSKELKKITEDRIIEGEFCFIEEKLEIIKKALKNYCFYIFEKCWYDIIDDVEIIQNVIEEYINCYSGTERVLERIEKGIFTDKTLELLIQDDIITSIKYLEGLKEPDLFENFFEFIVDDLDNYFVDNEKIIKIIEVK